jgi:hypothetical protein
VAEIVHVTYRIEFGAVDAVAVAKERLASAGFAVLTPADDTSGLVLEASLTAEDDHADAALAESLAGVDHDPLIEWHRAKLTGFV